MDNSLKADITGVIGAMGNGKSTSIKAQIAKYPRVVVWDLKREYPNTLDGFASGTLREIADNVERGGRYRLAFYPAFDEKQRVAQFNALCQIAYTHGDLTLVVEEAWAVVKPGWAPPFWQGLNFAGRAKGVRLIATVQRPASINKDFLTQCTTLRCFRQGSRSDAKVMADVLDCEWRELLGLLPGAYIERDASTGKIWRKKIALDPRKQ